MASYNQSHHETGGVVLFSGELILLFCDGVSVSDSNSSETGRLYLTTHRMVFTSKNTRAQFRSLSVPFYSITNVKLEQPIFGANYIKATANGAEGGPSVTFKLKFMHGGAIEYGQAMDNAARLTRNQAPGAGAGFGSGAPFSAPPAYTPSASQYYQAPPTVYQPAYNCGFALPNQTFDQPPPAGFVYMTDAPPPYPGLGAAGAAHGAGYPPAPAGNGGHAPGYPPPSNGAVPGAYTPASMGGGPGIYPGQAPPPATGPGYPGQSVPPYPGQSAPPYPGQSAPPGLGFSFGSEAPYPSQQPGGYPAAPGYPNMNHESAYPNQFPSAPPLPEKK